MIDLHIHSTYSDGELTPIEILHYCNQNDIHTIAITDHENTLGSKEAVQNNPYSDILIISGIEMNALPPKEGQMHILGYNVDYQNQALQDISRALIAENKRRLASLVKLLYKSGIKFKDKDLEEVFSSKGNLGRPHIGKLCVQYGYAPTLKDAFKTLFSPLMKDVEKERIKLTSKECINYIHGAGGLVSLAHPITLKLKDEELFVYLQTLANMGIDAIEVFHSSMSKEYSKQLITYANQLNLLQSGGSDYHGPIVKPEIKIGTGNNNLNMTHLSILERIKGGAS